MRYLGFLAALAASHLVAAHPGEDIREELEFRRQFITEHKRNLNHCAHKLKARGLGSHIATRQNELARKLKKRALPEYSPHDHDSLQEEYWFDSKASCVLAPQEGVGPYYVTNEYIREDISEDQDGILLAFGIQFIDYTNCEPVADAWVDVWHSNSTGVYSGVINPSNGQGSLDPSNEQATFHRGVQKTDESGVAQFITTFPGHYGGRAPHIHVLLHPDAQPTRDDTIFDIQAAHVGQVYFDQEIIFDVELREPYTQNRQPLTLNQNDPLLQDDLKAGGFPFMDLLQVDITIDSGMLGWITFGINTTASRTVKAVGTHHPESDLSRSTAVPDLNEELR